MCMAANECVMCRNGCRLFVLLKLECGIRIQNLRHDAAGAGLKPWMAVVLRPNWSETGYYSLPVT